MSNRSVFAFVVLISMAACTTMNDSPMGAASEAESEMTACYPGHRPPSQIAVVVYKDASGQIVVLPERVIVEHPNQSIVWTGVDGEMDEIMFDPSDCSPAPPSLPGRARQKSTRIGAGHKGTHKYRFTFHPDKGSPVPVDPMIIVEY